MLPSIHATVWIVSRVRTDFENYLYFAVIFKVMKNLGKLGKPENFEKLVTLCRLPTLNNYAVLGLGHALCCCELATGNSASDSASEQTGYKVE